MKFGTLTSIGHNIADSVASGIGLMIGVYEIYIFREAAAAPEGFIEVDFLAGEATAGEPSAELQRALKLYAEALPDLCKRQGVDVSDFNQLSVRFSGGPMSERFTVTIEDRNGRSSVDEYFGLPGKRPRVLDHLGRVRRA
ncbi:MAG: hypothetical protein ABIQ32_02805 [Sphingomicrobium sp.]